MWDVRIAAVAGKQFNRISRGQLHGLGLSDNAIAHRVKIGRLAIVGEGVFAVPPVLESDRGDWMGATLTAPGSRLSLGWAGYAWGWWYRPSGPITITRPGSGGPRRMSGVIAYRSTTIAVESDVLDGIPITSVHRTFIDLARSASRKALAYGVREAIRLERTTFEALSLQAMEWRARRGAKRLLGILREYSGLPLDRARSGAEIRALQILREAKRPMPDLNVKVAGREADLVWRDLKLIIEIDGGPYHQDVGEDARKEEAWRSAGFNVRRLGSDDVYERPSRLLARAPSVQRHPV